MKTITNKFKIALVAVGLLAIGTANAQTTTGNVGKQAAAGLGDATGYVKVIDNKGTIKYLQSSNGITQFTDNAPDGGVVTTWQLGGTLTSNTYITANGANQFNLDGLELVTDIATASTNAGNGDISQDGGATTTGSGFTVVIRDEASGKIQKMQLADLLQVQTIGLNPDYVHADPYAAGNVIINVAGLPDIAPGTAQEYKLFVFRNGAKLRLGVDFTIASGTDSGDITFLDAEVPMYQNDVIEVQYIR